LYWNFVLLWAQPAGLVAPIKDLAVNGNKRRFDSIERSDIPRTRKSKHTQLVEKILLELGELRQKEALKIPRSALGPAKLEHIRAALSRASSRDKIDLATSSDDKYLYVWRQD
jgi:hypothetical protein